MAAADRIDPYWAALWGQGSNAAWVTADTARRQLDAGIATLPARLHLDEKQAWERILGVRLSRYLDVLAVLDVWRTVTAEQLAAILQRDDLGTGRSPIMADLFAAGLIDVGIFHSALNTSDTRATLYRPARTTVFDRRLKPLLTRAEWISVTGGHEWESGSQFDRHNLLTSELILRAAEQNEVAAVMGEKLSSWDLLAHSGAGFDPASGRPRHADGTIVRTDGARIAIEMTASTGVSFEAKVRRWASLLSNRRFGDTGLAVIFVVASPASMQVRPESAAVNVRKIIAAAVRDHPGVDFDRTANRFMVASYTDWFPAAGVTDPSFHSLDALRPTGPLGDPWQPVSALDVIDLPFDANPRFDPEAIIDNITLLRSQPAWLRRGQPPQVWTDAIRGLGFTGVPVPAPTRPATYRGKPLGAAFGVSGDAKPPKRLMSAS